MDSLKAGAPTGVHRRWNGGQTVYGEGSRCGTLPTLPSQVTTHRQV